MKIWIGALVTGVVSASLGAACGGGDSSAPGGDGGGDGTGGGSGGYSSSGSGGSSGVYSSSGSSGSGGSSSGSSGSSSGVSSGGSSGAMIGDAGTGIVCGGDGSVCLTGQVCCLGNRRTGNTCHATCPVGTQVCTTNAECPAGEVCMGVAGAMTCRPGRGLDGGGPMRDAATNG
jgi:hypothetical protein